MKPTKRQCDPLGRSKTRHRYSRYLLSLAIAITGSVWPIQARSIEPIFDSQLASTPVRRRQRATRRTHSPTGPRIERSRAPRQRPRVPTGIYR